MAQRTRTPERGMVARTEIVDLQRTISGRSQLINQHITRLERRANRMPEGQARTQLLAAISRFRTQDLSILQDSLTTQRPQQLRQIEQSQGVLLQKIQAQLESSPGRTGPRAATPRRTR